MAGPGGMSAPVSIARRTLTGAGWLVGARMGTRAIDLVTLLVLARILTPADFGVIAIGMTLIQLVEAVLELPVGQVLVRAPMLTPALLSTAFTLSLMRGLALAAILVASAWPFAWLYGDPRLAGLICFLSLAPALRGLGSPGMIVFARAIDFRREVALELAAKAIAFPVAAAAAWLTGSYWAIALGTVCAPLVLMLGSYLLAPHRPALSLAEWRMFAGFLGWTTAAQAITAINWQADRPILGLFVPPATLGTYSIANDLSLLPEQALLKPIGRPLLSAFAGIQHDPARLARAYVRSAGLVLAAGAPVMIGLAFLAMPATRLVLGPKWVAAAPIVQWLALTLVIPLFSAPMGPLAMSLGRTHVFFRQSVVELALRLPITLLLSWRFGVPGLIVARLLTSIINTTTSMHYVRAMIGLGWARQLAIGARPLAGGAAMAAVLLALRPWLAAHDEPALAVGTAAAGLLGLAAYAGASVLAWRVAGRPDGAESAAAAWIGAWLARRRTNRGGKERGNVA